MTTLVALVGLLIGNLLNLIVDRQSVTEEHPLAPPRASFVDWIPIVGSVRRRDWVALVVELATGLMAVALFRKYGFSGRGLALFGASLVLIDTGAVDFRIRMIYTGEMILATLLALALAPVTGIGWLSSMLGLATALGLFIFLFLLAKMLFRGHAAPFGLGDVYLAAFIGALVGFLALPTALFYGMLLAGVVALALILLRAAGRDVPTYIAYGTYLCLGVLLFLVTQA